jgi:sporulation protein YpjB
MICLSCVLLLISFPNESVALDGAKELTNEAKLNQMNQLAVDIYEATTHEDYMAARQKLDEMSRMVTDIRYKEITSVEGMGAFVDSINEARRLFNAARFEPEAALVSIAKIRFAVDALLHTHQPLWFNYYSVLKEDVAHLQDAKNRLNLEDAQKHSKALSVHYSIIRPAALITRSPEMIEKMDSIVTFIQKQVGSELTLKNNVESGLEHLRYAVDELFLKDKSTLGPIGYVSTPVSIMVGIAAVIISVLSFVAWKKFKASGGPIYG